LDNDVPTPGDELSDDHLTVYWYFWDSRNRLGTPKKTRTMAMADLRMKFARLTALMDEIQDAGYWHVGDNGTPQFGPSQPPRPTPPWAEPEDPSALAQAGAHAGARSQKLQLLATSQSKANVTSFGGSSIPRGAMPTSRPRSWRENASRAAINDLVDYFSYKVRKSYGGFAPDPINGDAIRAGIRRWLTADGLSHDMVKAMIEIFVSEPQFMRKGIPAWKSFLAQRQRLITLAEDRRKRVEIANDWKRGKK
jgi:hypothetical protein